MANGVYIGIDSNSFTNNPAPITGWTTDSYSNSTANNSYGTWEIQSTSSYGSSSYSVDKAFDGNADTAYITNTLTSDEQEEYLYLILPNGLSIKPSKISAKFSNSGTSTYPCCVQGYNGADWVNLATLTSTYKTTEETYDITTSEYYTQFRLTLHRYSSTKTAVYIYSFEITSGETKLPSGLAHKVKAMYVGVDGVARKVKKGYIGVNGVARLFYFDRTATTTSSLIFGLNNYTDGSKTITGQSITSLQDGTTPTLKVTTTSTNGFLHSTTNSKNYTSVYTYMDGTKSYSMSDINSILARTNYSSDYYMLLNGYSTTSTYLYTAKFVFDFIEPRKLTLKIRISPTPTSVDGYFYGSDDGVNWVEIGDIENATSTTRISSTAYRYYKVEVKNIKQLNIYQMYFTDIDDWS